MIKTIEWAEELGIETQDNLPPVEEYNEQYKRTAADVAKRTVILHSMAAVGYGIRREPMCDWLQLQGLWKFVSPREKEYFLSRKHSKFMEEARLWVQWLQESQWALLWAIGRVDSLGLPVRTCDSLYLVNNVMPAPGEDVEPFILSASMRNAQEIRAEEQRVEKLFFHAREASDKDELPEDFIYGVLFQRLYAFRWLDSDDEWDNVNTDVHPF